MPNALVTPPDGWSSLLDNAFERCAGAGLDPRPLWAGAGERERALERLRQLLALVLTWNARVDLTAARDARELVDLYLPDALVLALEAQRLEAWRPNASWLDVGSGAGAPGLALAVLRPKQRMCLVEPRQKRVAFLRSAIGQLQLDQVSVVEGRSEGLPDQCHDVALSRATFAPSDWLIEGARLSRGTVWVLLARAETPRLDGYVISREIDYHWPLTGVRRRTLGFEPEALASLRPG